MQKNLYRDEINQPKEPTKIETDAAKFENEASQIIKHFREDDEFVLSYEDSEKLKLFFAIMGFRAKRVGERFADGEAKPFLEIYSKYQKNEDYLDFWKRQLGYLMNCRSYNEVIIHSDIADPIKLFMRRDTYGLYGTYFVLLEKRGSEEFVITDTYPTVIFGSGPNISRMNMYSMFPISPKRLILLAYHGVEDVPENVLGLRRVVFRKSENAEENGAVIIRPRKIYEIDVKSINRILEKESVEGFAFQNRETISIES
jgi:hypothetical protein